jgi:hypothetical protein
VKITTSEEVLLGDGLEANQDFSRYKILHPSGSKDLPEEKSDSADEGNN